MALRGLFSCYAGDAANSTQFQGIAAISSALRDQAWGPQDIGGHLSYELL